jgi:cystathionine gamma-synthase
MLFPSRVIAERCVDFFQRQAPDMDTSQLRIVDLIPAAPEARLEEFSIISPHICAVLYPYDRYAIAKSFWQHTGEGISSRRAEHCHDLFKQGLLVASQADTVEDMSRYRKGPRRYQRTTSIDLNDGSNRVVEGLDPSRFVEERFGRNLDISMALNAKSAVRRRIAGSLTEDVDLQDALSLEKNVEKTRKVTGFSEDDVYLYPCGMNSIYNTHRNLLSCKPGLKSIVYG